MKQANHQRGVTLIETIVFIVVISIALVALVRVYEQSVINSVDPLLRVRALELAQAQMDEVLSRKFDENTPTGGIPACDTAAGIACAGIVADAGLDDVGDYNANPTLGAAPYTVTVSVVPAGAELGIANTQARRVTVNVTMPGGDSVILTSYRTNF